jgi:hypothetical protein
MPVSPLTHDEGRYHSQYSFVPAAEPCSCEVSEVTPLGRGNPAARDFAVNS